MTPTPISPVTISRDAVEAASQEILEQAKFRDITNFQDTAKFKPIGHHVQQFANKIREDAIRECLDIASRTYKGRLPDGSYITDALESLLTKGKER